MRKHEECPSPKAPSKSPRGRDRGYLPALKIALIYCLFAALFIFVSDKVTEAIAINKAALTTLQAMTGLSFIVSTALLIFVLVYRSFTLQNQLINKLRMREAHLRTLVETIPDLVWLKDTNGVYITCNPAFEGFFGAKEKDIIGKTDFDFVDNELANLFREKDKIAMKKDRSSNNEEWVTFANDGHRALLETIKTPMHDSSNRLIGVLGIARDITTRKQTEELLHGSLHESEERFGLAMTVANDGIWDWHLNDNSVLFDARFYTMAGYEPNEFPGDLEEWQKRVHPDDIERLTLAFEQYLAGVSGAFDSEFRFMQKDGDYMWIQGRGEIFARNKKGVPTRFVGTHSDITERKKTEEALRRAQKMDAIGQMAGGIAHDFNNILAIIIGNLSFLKHLVAGDEKALKRVSNADKAALRAADLTKQLLGFSRKQAEKALPTNINQLIQGMDSLISRSITPAVEMDHHLTKDLWLVEIDAGDFEDALLNMILNARDAMPEGGRLTIETSNKVLDADYAKKNTTVVPGEYVELVVEDTGCGISKDVLDSVFEPFFTTKPQGKGTGLGMSMVFGFIQRSKGHVKIDSEPGIGTTILCYLPRSDSVTEGQNLPVIEERPQLRGRETILVVDDEEGLLELAQQYLEKLGYTAVTAKSGQQALQVLAERPSINLLFSDVVMPGGMNGYQLTEQAVANHPGLRVLLTSGYANKSLVRNGQARFEANLLIKPYDQDELARRVRLVLDE